MRTPAALLVVARLAYATVVVATALVCVLAYVPFTYVQFLQFPHLTSLTLFIRYQHLVYPVALVGVLATLRDDAGRPGTRRGVAAFAAVHGVLAVVLLARPLLPRLGNDAASLAWALGLLASLPWLLVLDLRGAARRLPFAAAPTDEEPRLFGAAGLAALYVTGVFLALAAAGGAAGGHPGLARVAITALAAYLVIFLGLFAFTVLLRGIAALTPRPPAAEAILHGSLAVVLLAVTLRKLVLSSISFEGAGAAVVAGALAVAVVAAWAGVAVRLAATPAAPTVVRSGMALLLAPRRRAGRGAAALLVVTPALAGLGLARLALFDWNFLLQKLLVLLVWLVAFAAFYAFLGDRWVARRGVALVLVALVPLGGYRLLGGDASVLERHAGADLSFALARQMLAAPVADPSFYAFLQASTNIPRSVKIEPVDLQLVEDLRPAAGPLPHIFLLVVDSLRADYLSPYDDAVDFTPRIAALARDSVVFENAFTRYGATGLSQPSIWVGGMLVHQQYPAPFHRLNTLQKMLRVDGYRSYIGVDTIMEVILDEDPSIVRLDEGRPDKDFELCGTLDELGDRLADDPGDRPIFAFTQAQDVHISTITRAGGEAVDDRDYGDFHAPYASRVRRIDACVGDFLDRLQELGLYDDSIVVLTADHGDSLGEGGRWGHAYTIFPEVLRIPLIVRLPERYRHLSRDAGAVTFSTDITPTLYHLLGHRPVVDHPALGRPLLAEEPATLAARRRAGYLVASSYGAVYGILSGDGETLFIADGVNYEDALLDLGDDPLGVPLALDERARARYRAAIAAQIEAIHELHGFTGR